MQNVTKTFETVIYFSANGRTVKASNEASVSGGESSCDSSTFISSTLPQITENRLGFVTTGRIPGRRTNTDHGSRSQSKSVTNSKHVLNEADRLRKLSVWDGIHLCSMCMTLFKKGSGVNMGFSVDNQ